MAAGAEAEQRKHDAARCASADKGDEPGVRAALEAGASPSAGHATYDCPVIVLAAECKHWGVVRILAEAGADLRATEPSGGTALSKAAAAFQAGASSAAMPNTAMASSRRRSLRRLKPRTELRTRDDMALCVGLLLGPPGGATRR